MMNKFESGNEVWFGLMRIQVSTVMRNDITVDN